jgi:hypothetical protein
LENVDFFRFFNAFHCAEPVYSSRFLLITCCFPDVEYLRRLLLPEQCSLRDLYPVKLEHLRSLHPSTQRLLDSTVSNAEVHLFQLCQRVAVDDDFPKTSGQNSSTFRRRFPQSDVMDSVPVRGKVPQPRVILAAPAQPLFDVLIQQPIVELDRVSRSLTIMLQCKWSAAQNQADKELRQWTAKATAPSSSASSSSSSSSSASSSSFMSDGQRQRIPDVLYIYTAARRVAESSLQAAGSGVLSNACVLPLDLTSLTSMWGPTISRCHVFATQMSSAEQLVLMQEVTAAAALTATTLSVASSDEAQASIASRVSAAGRSKRPFEPAAQLVASTSSSSSSASSSSARSDSKRAKPGRQ